MVDPVVVSAVEAHNPPPAGTVVTTTTVRRRSWKLLALNIVSGLASTVLAVLGYLQTVNLAGILTPEKALLYVVAVNVANIVLRQWFSPPQVVEQQISTGGPG
ncbi:hypothetical protein [Methylobacterium trifolii]|uniref:GtrA-like protein domain-containing protein n=1 Tax=Methylobacterium trifolii TaxID=1003092 RepID=A0ABQ4U5R2_9HYPH|nr:hypothetical protein [Methylobacterium trifolii]GJE61688.1 hypothetical protein MPOCJGCO_3811 [Methylobacterium trifolii]